MFILLHTGLDTQTDTHMLFVESKVVGMHKADGHRAGKKIP